jgi:hypothetical protein
MMPLPMHEVNFCNPSQSGKIQAPILKSGGGMAGLLYS